MKKGVPRVYYLIPFLYIALSSAFLYLHFTRTESHIEQIGYLTLSVESKHGSNRDRTEIQSISVYMNGFAVNIGKDTPVWLYDNTIPFKAEIVGYRTFPTALKSHSPEICSSGFSPDRTDHPNSA